jgi:hypothetical protein
LKKLLPLRQVVHVQQRSAVELYVSGLVSREAEPVLQSSHLRGERVIERESALEDSPGGRHRTGLNTAGLLREKQGLLMEHDRC